MWNAPKLVQLQRVTQYKPVNNNEDRKAMRSFLRLLTLIVLTFVVVLAACSPEKPGDNTNPEDEVPITSSDDCNPVVSASGITVDAEEVRRGNSGGTLPNGRPFPGTAPQNTTHPDNLPVPNQVMIQFMPESSQQDRNAYIRSIQGRSRRNIDKISTYVVTLPPNSDTSSFPESDIVARIELDYKAVATQVITPPNDPRYGEQWAPAVMGVPQAWAQLDANAPIVVVAVIDSGVCLNHPDLAGKIIGGYDFVDDDAEPQDVFGHGCGVAGVIAANINNGAGIAGVAPNARIMALRVLDETGIGTYSDISAAIVYAADNGAQIINLSLAGGQNSEIMSDAIDYALARNVMVIAAAGNFNTNLPFYPAALPAVIAVGSVDPDLQKSSFSNYGDYVDIQAPGRDILTTSINGDYELMSGTSFAAPQVAGISAMIEAFDVPLNMEAGVVFLYPPENLPDCE